MNEDIDINLDDKVKEEIKKPERYNVLLLNDDFTPYDFVINVLMSIFGKNKEEAEEITMLIHNSDKAIVGEYTKDIATSKAQQVIDYARVNKFVLRAEVSKV